MSVAAVGSTNTASSQTGSASGLDKNTFLKLFTTQLKNQDPLNPMDSTAFTAQLAQFSSLEQLYNVNDSLKTLVAAQNSLFSGMAVNLIGKQVTLNDGSSGKVTGVSYDGTITKLNLDNKNSVLFSDIKQISA